MVRRANASVLIEWLPSFFVLALDFPSSLPHGLTLFDDELFEVAQVTDFLVALVGLFAFSHGLVRFVEVVATGSQVLPQFFLLRLHC